MKTENDRMRDLVKLFEKKDEIFLKEEDKTKVNEDVIKNELERLDDLGTKDVNSLFREDYFTSNNYGFGGQNKVNGRTVNSIVDNMYSNPSVAYRPIRQPLTAEEAIELAIQRALKAGAPVNDMGFYDEVNWNLNNLGFPAKSPLDIKNSVTKLMERGK